MSTESSSTPVESVMTRSVYAVEPGMSVADALMLAREHSVSHLPVISAGQPVGVVCSCDLEDAPINANVSLVMHTPPVSIGSDEQLGTAIDLMASLGVGSILVTRAGVVSGIVTRTDIERAGLAEAAFGERRCSVCRTPHHVRLDPGCGYWLCIACRSKKHAPRDPRELGNGD